MRSALRSFATLHSAGASILSEHERISIITQMQNDANLGADRLAGLLAAVPTLSRTESETRLDYLHVLDSMLLQDAFHLNDTTKDA